MAAQSVGNARSGVKRERAPYDWYCESPDVVTQLMDAVDFGDDLIFDPSCGRGNVLDVARARGHATIGSDIIDRHPRHAFKRGNFLQMTKMPTLGHRSVSIINNPPYGYVDGIAEAFIRKALSFPVRRAAFILPIAFLASAGRWRMFAREFIPSHVGIYSERPTMPPGHMIEELGDKAFKGGLNDYCAIVFTHPHKWRTELMFLKPSSF